jgi:hypothetical protein
MTRKGILGGLLAGKQHAVVGRLAIVHSTLQLHPVECFEMTNCKGWGIQGIRTWRRQHRFVAQPCTFSVAVVLEVTCRM